MTPKKEPRTLPESIRFVASAPVVSNSDGERGGLCCASKCSSGNSELAVRTLPHRRSVKGVKLASIAEWSFLDSWKLSREVGRYLANPHDYCVDEFIEAAQKAVQEKPDSWVVWYSLADRCCQVGRYTEAMSACERCLDLRPRDIRSFYSIATVYNMLTYAEYSGARTPAMASDIMRLRQKSGIPPGKDILSNPYRVVEAAAESLVELGMTVEDAAQMAFCHFSQCLRMQPERNSEAAIAQHMATLKTRFPGIAEDNPRQSRVGERWWSEFNTSFQRMLEHFGGATGFLENDSDERHARAEFNAAIDDSLALLTAAENALKRLHTVWPAERESLDKLVAALAEARPWITINQAVLLLTCSGHALENLDEIRQGFARSRRHAEKSTQLMLEASAALGRSIADIEPHMACLG